MSVLALVAAHLVGNISTDQYLLTLVNSYRAKHGIEALTLNSKLCTAADKHALFMSSNRILSHYEQKDLENFSGENLSERANKVG